MTTIYRICFMLFLMVFSYSSEADCYLSANGDPIVQQELNLDNQSEAWRGIDFVTDNVYGNVNMIRGASLETVMCDEPWRVKIIPATYPPIGVGGWMDTGVKSLLMSANVGTNVGVLDFTNNTSLWKNPAATLSVSSYEFEMKKSSTTVVGNGVINAGPIAYLKVEEQGGLTYDFAVVNINAITVHAGSCIVSSNNTQLDLGTYPPQFFSGIGTSTPSKYFPIAVQCDPKLGVYGKFDGIDTSPAVEGVFGLVGNNKAEGIGVRIEPYTFGSGSGYLKNGVAERWVNGDTPEGHPVIQIGFMAAYYQYASVVTPGDATTTVTYTVTYD